ncbi:tRNA lysidine(34) synthetase TilS [Brevibacillus halotolerans]|uniref:tRNA(Ile)-lysidine synthase n=1 Tax=Brevibacillus laterosporus TaxID=1465 RepID=A0A0F7EG93_BRELA|nr:tRNA lysidine(34) synthetase TilS [Brevibacillus halotolerans]AKF93617.1 tRNA(Ile)-lysidine synthetase [Brevibacillus laterosporus]
MYEKVQKRMEQDRLLLPHESIVVGVSGGVDSTALLHILSKMNEQYQYGWKLYAVHLNHGFRGEESDQDAAYVEDLCHTLGVKCYSFYESVPEIMKETGQGPQVASRELRYQYYRQVAKEVGATKVALAHHADDQVETILFRMMRGTSLHGFTGMPQRRWLHPEQIELVRPLLHVFREELEAYCEANNLQPRHDSSNDSRKYKRNLLRHEVTPHLQQVNLRYREHVLQLAEMARVDDDYLQKLSQEALNRIIVRKESDKIILDRKCLKTFDLALQRRMIPLILSYLATETEWSLQHVEAVLRIIFEENPSAVLHLPSHIFVERVYEQVCFRRQKATAQDFSQPYSYPITIPGTIWIEEAGMFIHTKRYDSLADLPDLLSLSPYSAVCDADALVGDCIIRSRMPGDRIQLGTAQHCYSKKLKELFIDEKVPKSRRDRIPILVVGDRIIWIPGVKRSTHAMIHEKSRAFVIIQADFREE